MPSSLKSWFHNTEFHRTSLDSAFVIAEQHKQNSPGEFARISYKQAILLQAMGVPEDDPVVAQKRVVSARVRAMIETEKLPSLPEENQMEEEARYDRLVCGFCR